MLKVRLIAPIPELVSETGIREGTAPIVHKESKVAAGRAIYDPLQYWQDWQREPLGLPVAALVLRLASARDRLPESRHFAECDVIFGVVRARSVHKGGYGHNGDRAAA
jgi:hypothetical protein